MSRQVNDYYAYIVGRDGHIIQRVELRFDQEADALEGAKQLVKWHKVELWQRDRQIAVFEPA